MIEFPFNQSPSYLQRLVIACKRSAENAISNKTQLLNAISMSYSPVPNKPYVCIKTYVGPKSRKK